MWKSQIIEGVDLESIMLSKIKATHKVVFHLFEVPGGVKFTDRMNSGRQGLKEGEMRSCFLDIKFQFCKM